MTDDKKIEQRVKTHWPFMRISEADFKLLKKFERMRKAQLNRKTPQGREAPF
jgi:hypothetical protein